MENLTIENVEKAIEQAIEKYWEKGAIADAIFWQRAIRLLIKKLISARNEEDK